MFTQHIQDVFDHEKDHDFMIYAYIQKMIATSVDELSDAQIDYVFDILHDTDRFELEADEYILVDLLELTDKVSR